MNTIRVIHLVDDTVTIDTWTAQHITHQMWRDGRTRICLWTDGRLTDAIDYRRVESFHQNYGPSGKNVPGPPSTAVDAETVHAEGDGHPEPAGPLSEQLEMDIRGLRAVIAAEIEAALAADQADSDVTSGEAIWEQGGYRNGLSAAADIARGEP